MSAAWTVAWWVVMMYLAVSLVCAIVAHVVWLWDHKSGFWPWVRRWNPIYLRGEITFLGDWLEDDRNHFADDATNTLVEQTYRRLRFISQGHSSPADNAARYRVIGHTLHIDATDRPKTC